MRSVGGVLKGALLSNGVLTIDARFGGDMNYYVIVLYYRHERKAMHQGYAITEVQTVINRYAVSNKRLYCTVLYCTVTLSSRRKPVG